MTTIAKIGVALGGIGIFFMIGTVGALEHGTISATHTIIQFAVSAGVAGIGALLYNNG